MRLTANWSYPTAIRFGAGRIAELPEACIAAGIRKPLLVTDRGLAQLPITAQALEIFDAAGPGRAIFSDVDPNPTEKNMEAGVAAFREGGHDGVIAFGGGSGLDLGKCVAFMAGQTRAVWDFEDVGDLMGGELLAQQVKGPIRQPGIVQAFDKPIQRSREIASHYLAHLVLSKPCQCLVIPNQSPT